MITSREEALTFLKDYLNDNCPEDPIYTSMQLENIEAYLRKKFKEDNSYWLDYYTSIIYLITREASSFELEFFCVPPGSNKNTVYDLYIV